jgi:BirA family biotin operon repressor/biotin-[acetyl-CoA-carboxylase] ligase
VSGPILTVSSTGSTNDDLLRLARDGAVEGTWLRADAQSGGRGRQGRAWQSPPGNLYASTLVLRQRGDPPAASLALVAGIAVYQTVAGFVSPEQLTLKWPNDLLLDGAKLCGILLEANAGAVVIGIGINLAHAPALDRPVTSLATANGTAPTPEEALALLGPAFASWLSRWREEGLDTIRREWLDRAHPIGTPLAADDGSGRRIAGLFDGLEPSGALRLRLPESGVRIVHAGDVFMPEASVPPNR